MPERPAKPTPATPTPGPPQSLTAASRPPLCTEDQRWLIFDLFAHFGITDMAQLRADASRILKLDPGLTDLRELTEHDADELLDELRRAVADERVSDE